MPAAATTVALQWLLCSLRAILIRANLLKLQSPMWSPLFEIFARSTVENNLAGDHIHSIMPVLTPTTCQDGFLRFSTLKSYATKF